jgi:uncharacterized protein YndB with AHSA1/START domain
MATTTKTAATTRFTMPSDRELQWTREFDAQRSRVYDAWTRPEHVKQWMFGPGDTKMTSCEIDLRKGGGWHYAWPAQGGKKMEVHGSFKEVVPNERLVVEESWGSDWPATTDTLTFTEKNGRTTITNNQLYASKEERDKMIGSGMKEGVSQSYERLDEFLRR